MKRQSIGRILLGLSTGAVFGFLLHKGRASEHEAISGQLMAEDASVVKIMATASAVGALGTQFLNHFGLAEAKIKPLDTGGIVLGGTLFGAGMAILGYCPGTDMAAVGAGHRDAAAGALGMLGGALAFVKLYPHIKPLMEKGSFGKRTLPELTGTSPWLWVAGTSAAVAAAAGFLDGGEPVSTSAGKS
ncbi:MAG: YeeE/YedE family protein [Desulfobacteraceae bacterium]|nr:MAG: YeeE/YedE family protein [Desulfobacteraceae bacterium]